MPATRRAVRLQQRVRLGPCPAGAQRRGDGAAARAGPPLTCAQTSFKEEDRAKGGQYPCGKPMHLKLSESEILRKASKLRDE